MITIQLFGAISVRRDREPVTGLSTKQRHILAILALRPGVPIPRERLADELWEGAPPASYVGTLDSYVCVLRRALGLAAGRSSPLATTSAGFVLERGDDIEIDLHSFQVLTRAAFERTGRPALEWTEEAVGLVVGDLLAEVPYAAWAVRAREDVARTMVSLCKRGAQRANGLGEFALASQMARSAVERDPVCEDAWRQLMLAHWFSGNRGEALSDYAELREAMAEYLGDEPGRESQELYQTILRECAGDVQRLGPGDRADRLRTLLQLIRQELDNTPGVRAPALDAQLSEVAVSALSRLHTGPRSVLAVR